MKKRSNREFCSKCNGALQVRQTRKSASQAQKPYYYTAYLWCPRCEYLYHDEQFKVVNTPQDELFEKFTEESETLNIWTDGACVFNGQENAKAAWAFVSGNHEEKGFVLGKQTNNTAEAYAIYHALVWAAQEGHTHVRIHSDSQITITNLQKPLAQIKENREIFADIYGVIEANNLRVSYVKVLGHSGDINNDRVDRLANTLAAS